jgi:hypothetical protein
VISWLAGGLQLFGEGWPLFKASFSAKENPHTGWCRGQWWLSEYATLGQTCVLRLRDDQVIMDRNAHDLPGIRELARDPDILSTWFWVTGWVLMSQDESGRIGQDGRLENLARFDNRGGQTTYTHLSQANHGMGRIEHHRQKLFAVFVLKVVS